MKKTPILIWLAFVLFFSPAIFAQSGTLTPEERSYLIEQLTKSKQAFIESIQGLSDAQWKYKATPEKWSIEECAEHIILAEDFIFAGSQKMLEAPAQPRAASSTPEHDREVFAMVQDRSHKATAPEPIRPTGQWPKPSEAIAEFTKRRDAHIAYVRDTKDELRTHSSADTPLGTLDAYQVLVLMAGHTLRHTAQIQEVKTGAGYPQASASTAAPAPPQTSVVASDMPKGMKQYCVALLLAGPNRNQSPEEAERIQAEHLAYIHKNFEARKYALAGPFVDDGRIRGIIVVAVDSTSEANQIVSRDPAVLAGRLTVEIHPAWLPSLDGAIARN